MVYVDGGGSQDNRSDFRLSRAEFEKVSLKGDR
jgi:hypothetical protein